MAGCQEGLEWCLCLRIWIFDILAPLLEKAAEFIVLIYLIQGHEYKWALMMAIAMLLPGLLESLYWTAMCCCGGRSQDVDEEEEDEDGKPEKTNFNKCCNWLFFYNPLLFPFTLVAWHVIVSCQEEEKLKSKFALSKVLRTLQVQTESFLMLLLQSHILSHTFALDREETMAQMVLVFLCVVNLAKDCAEHHFHELSGKTCIPFCRQVFPTLFFYILQILLRLPSMVLLTIYLGEWFGLVLAALLPINSTLASLNLRTLTAKNVWTGLTSTLAPICFVDRSKIKDHLDYGEEFYAYYLWNSLGYFTTSIAAHVLVNGLLYDTSSITGGYFMTNVRSVWFLGEYCTADICWSVHAASLCAIVASLIQVCTILATKQILYRTTYHSGDAVSLSYYGREETPTL